MRPLSEEDWLRWRTHVSFIGDLIGSVEIFALCYCGGWNSVVAILPIRLQGKVLSLRMIWFDNVYENAWGR